MQQDRIHPPTPSAAAANGTLPTDLMHPRTPPPPYFSVDNEHLHNFHNQNFESAFEPLENTNHPIQTHHTHDVVRGQTVMINSEPTDSCNTGQVVGKMTVLALFALCFLMIRLFIRSLF